MDNITLNEQMEEFWKVESFGIKDPCHGLMSVKAKHATKMIENMITKVDGHYQMGLPWKESNSHLPFNRPMAEIRLHHLKCRLEKDP